MADNTDDGGSKNARPGETPGVKRPFATLDLKATEVAGSQPASAAEAKPAAPGPADKPEAKIEPKPAPAAAKGAGPGTPPDTADRPKAAKGSAAAFAASSPLLTHFASGAFGALIVLALTYAFTPDAPRRSADAPDVGELTRRVSELEGVLGTRPGSAGLRARIDEMSRNLSALGNAQAKLARESKEFEDRIGSGKNAPSELAARVAKLEQGIVTALPADQATGQSQPSPALAAKMAELERAAQEASEAAKSATARLTAELAAIRTEAGRLSSRVDGIKGEVEERLQGAAKAADIAPIAKKIGALEQDLQGYVKTESGRRADAGRIVLALELGVLRRAIDRGDSYTAELAAVKGAAGDTLNLAPLERHMREGVSPVRDLEKSFRGVANAMFDAEADRTDANLVDRLISSARSVVRVRKLGHTADDVSAEAVIGRMETALKEGRLAEVLEQAKRLPPKAALAGEDWVKRVEARQSVDKAMADVDAALKASLGAVRAGGTEPQR